MMDTIRNEILYTFYSQVEGRRTIESIDSSYPSYILKNNDIYGVAIPYYEDEIITESFSNMDFGTQKLNFDGSGPETYLTLTSKDFKYKDEFSHLCLDFIYPGHNGENRERLLENPLSWWVRWRDLVGNRIRNQKPYSVVAELLTIKRLQELGNEEIHWFELESPTHDIETLNAKYEVKSSLTKRKTEISISSQFQLSSEFPLFVIYYRMEESADGFSVDDVVDLISTPENKMDYNIKLSEYGLPQGSTARKIKYTVLESRKYEVNENFPILKLSDINNEQLLLHLQRLNYTIDLTGIDFDEWE